LQLSHECEDHSDCMYKAYIVVFNIFPRRFPVFSTTVTNYYCHHHNRCPVKQWNYPKSDPCNAGLFTLHPSPAVLPCSNSCNRCMPTAICRSSRSCLLRDVGKSSMRGWGEATRRPACIVVGGLLFPRGHEATNHLQNIGAQTSRRVVRQPGCTGSTC
jgi:hypothetical protein